MLPILVALEFAEKFRNWSEIDIWKKFGQRSTKYPQCCELFKIFCVSYIKNNPV